ncbi:hypothetical protein, partial [Liquorilactobacillus satsumensis]|uniref:hypothetical protein n=1 Tax=Liquorilactobacillus satsumensis TaxID=259059 RepID=UPI0039E75A3A
FKVKMDMLFKYVSLNNEHNKCASFENAMQICKVFTFLNLFLSFVAEKKGKKYEERICGNY